MAQEMSVSVVDATVVEPEVLKQEKDDSCVPEQTFPS